MAAAASGAPAHPPAMDPSDFPVLLLAQCAAKVTAKLFTTNIKPQNYQWVKPMGSVSK